MTNKVFQRFPKEMRRNFYKLSSNEKACASLRSGQALQNTKEHQIKKGGAKGGG